MERIDHLEHEFATQAAFLKEREPVYERLLAMLADAVRGEFGARLAAVWAARRFNSPYERPLLLLAALRYDALCEGESHPLHDALVTHPDQIDGVTTKALAAALSPARVRIERVLRDRAVQTNETTRAVAWLWPASLVASMGDRRPLALVDLGASAGLNLVADDLPALWVNEQGEPIPLEPRPRIARRRGLDVAPLDVCNPDDAMWLKACVWPSDRSRLARLERAIAAFRAKLGRDDAPVLEACALTEAGARLASIPDTMVVLAVQTIVRDYLSPAERQRYEDGMRAFLLARCGSALWVELEVGPDYAKFPERSATLTVRLSSAEGTVDEFVLARTHPHPRRLFIDVDGLRAFSAAIRRG